MSIEDTLWLLAHSDDPNDKKEWAVLYWKSQGLKHQEIADGWGYTKEWVQHYMTRIHRRFETPKELNQIEKNEWLENNVYPALRKFLEDHPETTKELPPPEDFAGDPEPPTPDPTSPVIPYQEVPTAIKIEPRKDRPIRACLFLVMTAVLIVGVGAAAFWFGRQSLPGALVNTTPSQEDVASSVASTDIPLSPSATLEPTIAVTDTPAPTNTPVPTATTNPNIFLDDFSDVLDPAWTVVQGKPVIVNGELTVSETTVLSIGDASWRDYEIQFDILVPGDHCALRENPEHIGVRASDLDNMLRYAFSWCDSEWRTLVNGQQTTIPNTNESGFKDDHVVFTVKGNQVILHVGSKLITTLTNEDFPAGYIYLRLGRGTLIDNFKVTLLTQ